MIGAPFVVLGLLLILSALLGARVKGRARGALGTFLLSPLHPATWYATLAMITAPPSSAHGPGTSRTATKAQMGFSTGSTSVLMSVSLV